MSEQAKVTARRFLEEQDRLRGGPAEDLCADGYSLVLGSFPPMDFESHKEFAAAFYAAFPDLRHVIEEVVAEGDRAVVRFRLKGTNSGSFMGNPPSGTSRLMSGRSPSSGSVPKRWPRYAESSTRWG